MGKSSGKTSAFGVKDKIGYTLGDFGCNMSFQLISSYAMIYFTQGMGLSLGAWAIIVVLAKVFDACNDPIIGALVDKRKPGKNGKFRPWILYSSFAILLTTALFFVDIRGLSVGLRFTYCLVMYCLWSIAYTSANVPYGSLNAVLTDDIAQRASLSSLRSIGAGVATVPFMILMPKLIYGEKDAATGISPIIPERFFWIALVAGIIGLVGFMLTYVLTTERTVIPKSTEKYEFKKAIKAFTKNRPAMGICIASFAQLACFFSIQVTVQYVFQVYFKNTDMMMVANVLMFAPMMIFIPFISTLTKKFGKKEMCTLPIIGSVVILLIMLFIEFPRTTAGGWMYVALVGAANAFTGLFTLTTWSFVADAVDYQELQTGRREEGTVYAIYSFVRKIGQAVCQGLTSILLAAIGFDTENIIATTDATAIGVIRLSILIPLVGAVLMFIALMFIYNLGKKETLEMSQRLKEIHAETAKEV